MAHVPRDWDVFSSDTQVLERLVADERAALAALPAQRTDETDEARARSLWRLGEALYRLRRRSEALVALEEAEQAAKLIPEWELVWARARCLRAACLLGLNRWVEVADLTEELVDVGAWLDRPYYVHIGLNARAVALESLDRWEEAAAAAAALRESLPVELSPRTSAHLREALLIQAWAAQRAGEPQSGLQFTEEAVALAFEAHDREPLSRALLLRAELLHQAGRSAEARETLQRVIDTFRDDIEDFAISAVAIARGRKLRMRLWPRRRPARG